MSLDRDRLPLEGGERHYQENLKIAKGKTSFLLSTCLHSAHKAVSPAVFPQAAQKAGLSAEIAQGLLEKSSTAQVKDQLKKTTEAACKYGVSNFPCVPKSCSKDEDSL